MDFFDIDCQEPVINESLFGLCDDESGLKAYTNTDDQTKWIATVKNDNNKDLIFTAIDKCVINDGEEPDRDRCDGMLISADNEHLFFVELKNQGSKGWLPKAKKQLKSTIQFFIEHHDVTVYKHKKVFACNKKDRHFQVVSQEENLLFYNTYGFRIDVQADIIIV